jgi:hypothetical protein
LIYSPLCVDGSDICASSGSGGGDSQQSMEKMYRQTYHVTKKWAEVRVKIVEWERMLDNMVEVGQSNS